MYVDGFIAQYFFVIGWASMSERQGAKQHEYDAIGHCGMVLEMASLAG